MERNISREKKDIMMKNYFLKNNVIEIPLNFTLLLFISIIVPTIGNKSSFIYKTYMIMPL